MEKPDKQQYLNEGGVRCPYCGSENLKCRITTTNDGFIYQKVTCLTCNKTWLDVYTLTDILVEN